MPKGPVDRSSSGSLLWGVFTQALEWVQRLEPSKADPGRGGRRGAGRKGIRADTHGPSWSSKPHLAWFFTVTLMNTAALKPHHRHRETEAYGDLTEAGQRQELPSGRARPRILIQSGFRIGSLNCICCPKKDPEKNAHRRVPEK